MHLSMHGSVSLSQLGIFDCFADCFRINDVDSLACTDHQAAVADLIDHTCCSV